MTHSDSESAPHVDLFNTSLRGKTALVCGASTGIGEACARVFAHLGARVIAVARNESRLKEVLASLEGSGHSYLALDLNDHASLQAKVAEALRRSGVIEILVNNSSGPKGGPTLDASSDEFAKTFHQHLLTNQLLAQLLVPSMKEIGYGRVINIISTSVKAPIPGLAVSNTVRAAVASWGKGLSLEVASDGITVNSVLPGYTRTGRLTSLLKATAERTGRTEDEIARDWKNSIPAGRFGEPREIAAVVAFLASPAAGYLNGVAMQVDGGRTPVV